MKLVQNFGGKTYLKEATWRTKKMMVNDIII